MAAYWIAHVHVTDADAYGEYARRATAAIEAHGGEFLARATRTVWLEGNERARNVVVRFPSVEDAERCYHSQLSLGCCTQQMHSGSTTQTTKSHGCWQNFHSCSCRSFRSCSLQKCSILTGHLHFQYLPSPLLGLPLVLLQCDLLHRSRFPTM